MKIKEMYLMFDKNNELKKGVTPYGQASCNLNGCICIASLIETLKGLVKKHEKTEKDIDILLNKWEQAETSQKETLGNMITLKPYKKSFYSEKYKEYSTIENNLYISYHNIIHAILTDDEIHTIQKKINYNFMSNLFINKMTELLESKEV